MEYKVPCSGPILLRLLSDHDNADMDVICSKLNCAARLESTKIQNGKNVSYITLVFANQSDYTMFVMRYC